MALGYVPREAGDAMMHIDKVQAEALAAFVGRIRPDWDHPGIVAAIGKARDLGSAAAVAAALCKLAENLELRTPAMLAQQGPHWAGTTVASRTPPVMCPEDGHDDEKAGACRKCEAVSSAPTAEFLAAKEALKRRDRPKAAHPQPATTDLRQARDRIDTAQEAQA